MIQPTVNLEEFQDHHEEEARKYQKKTLVSLCLAGGWMLILPVILFVLEQYFFVSTGKSEISQAGSVKGDCQGDPYIAVLFSFFYFMPPILLILYLVRLGRNPLLRCPFCSKLLSQNIQPDLKKTGMCPFCKKILFQETRFSEQEARDYYEQKRIASDLNSLRSIQGTARVFAWSAIILLPVAPSIYFWIHALEEEMGKGAALRNACIIVVFSLSLFLFSWLCLSEKRRLEQQLENTAIHPEGLHGSENGQS